MRLHIPPNCKLSQAAQICAFVLGRHSSSMWASATVQIWGACDALRKKASLAAALLVVGLLVLMPGCTSSRFHAVDSSSQQDISEEIDHSCSYFYFLWGRHAELRLQFDEALEAYEKALICDPMAEYIRKKIPILLLRMERTEEAETRINSFLEDYPKDLSMGILAALVHLKNNRRPQAIAQYRKVIKLHPENPLPRLRLAELYLEENEYEKARKSLLEVLEIDQNLYQAHMMLARLSEETKDLQAAINHYRKALESEWSAELLLVIGDLLVQSDKLAQATEAYREILEHDEHNLKARVALFQAYHLLGKDKLAMAELERLRNLAAKPGQVNLAIAKLYIQQKQYAKAASLLEAVLQKEKLPEARILLARLYFKDDRYEPALNLLSGLEGEEFFRSEVVFLRIRLLQLLEREKETTVIVEQMMDRQDINIEEKLAALVTLYTMGSEQEVVRRLYQKGINSGFDKDIWHYEYGLFLEYIGEHDAAMEEMQRVIVVNPDHAAALNFVGYTWADEGRHLDKALLYLQRAVALKPDNGYIRDSLGWVFFRLGRIEEALVELEKAVRLSPDDPAIYDHLGDVFMQQGRVDKARAAYQRAIELYEDDPESSEAVKRKLLQLDTKGNE